ncbi:entericidin [Sodaliphilus sp.]|uniref:PG1828 family lipoprotein n=1 Tax=Sodaliphilus sp. TaxID=2815818 RepID=UPI00388FFE55
MKKLVLLLAVVFGVSFVSCDNADKAEAAADSAVDSTVVEDTTAAPADSAVTVDSVAADSVK